jgi:cytochrome P450
MNTTTTSVPIPPGPKGHFLLGSLPAYSRDPLKFMSDCARTYGDIVYLTGLIPSYLLNHPDFIEEMLVTQHQYLLKSQLGIITKPLLGNGLLLSEGDFWKQQRHLIQPAFHRNRIVAYAKVMVDYTQQMLDTWQHGEIRNVHHEMMNLTLAIAAKTFFGSAIESDVDAIDRAVKAMLNHFDRRTTNWLLFLLPDYVPTPENLHFRHAIKQLDSVVYRLIQERRSSGKETDDLLSMLLHMQADDGTQMSDRQVRDEVNTFLLAGHETTALALSWVWYLLSKHPEIEAKLLAELQTVLAGRSPNLADLPQLRYTEWIVLEAMRLYPPVWAIVRTIAQDCEIAGYPVKAGHGLVASPWVVHRDPRWFSEPEKFNPDRWDNDFAKHLPSFAYFPFGGGSRICIGKAFAMMEACLLLATIASTYRMRLVSEQPVEPWASLTLRPKQAIQVFLESRVS